MGGVIKAALAILLLACTAHATDICGNNMTYPGTLESPGFPSPYANSLECSMTLTAGNGRLTRLQFQSVDFRDDGDGVMVEDEYGAVTWVTGSAIPKTFLSTVFHVTFVSDGVNTNGTGFQMVYDEYPRDAVPVKETFYEVAAKPGKPLHLYSNDYPMFYDDNTHYIWNITSSGPLTITVVDLEMEEHDWMKLTAFLATGDPVEVLSQMGTPTTSMGPIMVADMDYVIAEFRSDYSDRASGFHVIVETSSVTQMEEKPESSSCGGNFTLEQSALFFSLPADTSDLVCVYRITNNEAASRIQVFVEEMDTEEGIDSLHVFTGLDPTDWSNYRRQLTGSISDEYIFLQEGHGVTLVFTSGSSNRSRSLTLTVDHVQDYGCGGTLDLTTSNGVGSIHIGNFSSTMTHVYCQWLVHTSILTNVNVRVSSMSESLYDWLEIGYGSDPTDIGSRLKLMTGDVGNQTYSTYNGDLWIVFSAEDLMADEVDIELTLDDDACLIETRLDLNGVVSSPQLAGGYYPNDADCQWIIQVRGGFQVRIHFTEFDLELGHDKLIIGGSNLVDDSFGTSYIVITGSELPNDVVSRFNGLNIRFTSDSSGTGSGFSFTYEEFFECPTGYSYNPSNDTCYKFVDTPADWWNARYDCDNVADGDIVVINDQDENAWVLEMITAMQGNDSSGWWVGYYDAAINGEWVWVDCLADTDFADTNWQVGAPNDLDDNHCAYMNMTDGQYNDDDCFNTRRYVCEVTRKDYVDSDCYPSNFQVLEIDDNDVSLSFNASEFVCDVSGYKIRYNTTESGDFIEIELEGALNTDVIISGLSPATTYLFELTTCTVTYGCYGYSTALSVLGTTTCPTNYELGPNGHCYRFRILEIGSWWPTGRRTCDDVADSDLVIVNDQAELDFLTSRSAEINSNMTWWVGYSDQSVEGDWRWVDCTESTEWQNDLWADGSPGGGSEDCAALQPSGDLVSLVCDETLSYICEISPKGFELQDANPSNLAVVATQTSMMVTWTPSDTSCDVIGYRVRYWLADEANADVSFELVYGGDQNSATIEDLLPDRMYNVTVGAFLSQDYELSPVGPVSVKTVAAIILQCSPTTMSVRVPLERLGGASLGTDLQLMNDGSCQGVISEDGMAIVITTNLTSCNNERREDATFEYYSNTVVEREYGVVTRVSDVYIPFTCTYNRTGRVGLRSYELKNYRLNVTEESSGQYAFALDIYRDEGFEEKYLEEDYPVDMDLNDDLYFGASVPSQEGTLDLSITRCVATPSSSFNDDQFLFIEDGCSVDEGTVIQPDELDFVGVTMKTFRFVGLGNRVYIHCDLLVCDATSGNLTECDVTCPSGLNGRQRRDVTASKSTLARTRISRGPIRFRRSSESYEQMDWMIKDDKPTETHVSAFNPWMLAIVAMVTIMIVLLVIVLVVVRKMTSVIRSQNAQRDDEASVPLMNE
ncbi:uncharacterized protein LOC129263433 [Lytechinus pictus]|uniref:uncharacterized protein LOC129263433 n=1 Tax=Lytechinus pictus TaxID=7653 RepID=UPI0030B9ECFC